MNIDVNTQAVTGRTTMWFVVGSSVGDLAIPAALSALFMNLGYAALPYAIFALACSILILLLVGLRVSPSRHTLALADVGKREGADDGIQLLERHNMSQADSVEDGEPDD